uniref:Lysosome membrane protein 2 n=1 Tax=Chrysemys picta bellii TaxID=8478 RepID=A0A8C3PA87_CHRPI
MEWAKSTSLRLPTEILLILYQENLFMTHTVHELLWGYKDKLLSTLHVLHPEIDSEFGLFNKMNGTDDGEYVVLSGKMNYLNFSKIVEWRGKESLNWWTTESCNMINGTDGSAFHPLISTDETIYVFSSDFCRSLYVTFDSFVSVSGIPAYRFVPPEKVFANTSVNPDNAGFCVPAGNCHGSGVLNVSFPFLSQLTGIVVQAAKRMQINVLVRKLDGFMVACLTSYLNVLIDEASAKKLKSVLFEATVVTSIPFIIMALGIILGICFILTFLLCHFVFQSSEEERAPLIRTS